jgi:hypothetical protein
LAVVDMGQINGKTGFAFGTLEFFHMVLLIDLVVVIYYRKRGK